MKQVAIAVFLLLINYSDSHHNLEIPIVNKLKF